MVNRNSSPKLAALPQLQVENIRPDSPRRLLAETFIRSVFAERFSARIEAFAPNLLLFSSASSPVAAAGWRLAKDSPLFLEQYLDTPIEEALSQAMGRPVLRQEIAEVGNLAATLPGVSTHVFATVARQLQQADCEWVTFTATRELVRIFRQLDIPLLALGRADPDRLGTHAAAAWGSYYHRQPVVVAGRIHHANSRLIRM